MSQASSGSCSHIYDEVTDCWVSSCGMKASVGGVCRSCCIEVDWRCMGGNFPYIPYFCFYQTAEQFPHNIFIYLHLKQDALSVI